MRINDYFKGSQFQVNGNKYIIIVDPNPAKSGGGNLVNGYYAYNPNTQKATSLDYLSLSRFLKNPKIMKDRLREILRKKIIKEKI